MRIVPVVFTKNAIFLASAFIADTAGKLLIFRKLRIDRDLAINRLIIVWKVPHETRWLHGLGGLSPEP